MDGQGTKNERKGIFYPALGLCSVLAACLVGTSSTGLNVHSGEIFIWISILLALGIVVPIVLFLKALEVVRLTFGREKSRIKTYSILLTYSLGAVVVGLLTFLLVAVLK